MYGSCLRNKWAQAGFEKRPRCRACHSRLINALFGCGHKNVSCHRLSQVRSTTFLQILTKAATPGHLASSCWPPIPSRHGSGGAPSGSGCHNAIVSTRSIKTCFISEGGIGPEQVCYQNGGSSIGASDCWSVLFVSNAVVSPDIRSKGSGGAGDAERDIFPPARSLAAISGRRRSHIADHYLFRARTQHLHGRLYLFDCHRTAVLDR